MTTAELAASFPDARVMGVEADASRVAQARHEFPHLELLAGELGALTDLPPLAVIRLANVSRGLTKEAAAQLERDAVARLVEGGLCLEGSTDVDGHLACFWSSRRRGERLVAEALVFHTDGARGFAPLMFRDVLPRRLRRDVKPGTPIAGLLEAWTAAWCRVRGTEAAFVTSALGMARPDVLVESGFVVWRQPG